MKARPKRANRARVRAREILPQRRYHGVIKFRIEGQDYTGGLGRLAPRNGGGPESGRVVELWLDAEKVGSSLYALGKEAAILASLALQYGCPIGVMRNAVPRNPDNTASGPIGVLLDRIAKGKGP